MSYTNRIFNWDLDMLNYFVNKYVLGPLRSMVGYYECATAAATAAKTVTASWFTLRVGGSMKIKMTYANTAASGVTLNINSTGAKSLYYDGAAVSANNTWEAGETIEVYYDGTSYYANNVAGRGGDGVYDISAHHGGATYADLSAALGTNGANVPASKRKGGMSVKFVSNSDNKYVQFRYMGTATTGSPNPFLDTVNWQGVDDEPTAGSVNLVESGGISSVSTVFNFVGVGNVYKEVEFDKIIAGHRYRIYPVITSWDYGTTSAAAVIFQIGYIKNDESKIYTYTRKYDSGAPVEKYVDITVPDDVKNNTGILIGGRAASGTKVYFTVVDITYAKERTDNINSALWDYNIVKDAVSKKLYAQNYTDNKKINQTYSLVDSNACFLSDYIPCVENDVITWTYSGSGETGTGAICCYNENKETLNTGWVNQGGGTRTVTNNKTGCAYIRVSFVKESGYTPSVYINGVLVWIKEEDGKLVEIENTLNATVPKAEKADSLDAQINNRINIQIGKQTEINANGTTTVRSVAGWNTIEEYIPIHYNDVLRWVIGGSSSSRNLCAFFDAEYNLLQRLAATNKGSSAPDARTVNLTSDTFINVAYVKLSYYDKLTDESDNLNPVVINGVSVFTPVFENGIEKRVEDIEAELHPSLPAYGKIGENYAEQIPDIVDKLSYRFSNRFHFLHLSDNHNSIYGYANELLDFIPAKFLVNTGDMVNDKFSDSKTNTIACSISPTKPTYLVLGNHDYSHAPSKQDVFDAFYGNAEIEGTVNYHNVQTGGVATDKTYYSVDFATEGVKCIMLDMNEGMADSDLPDAGPNDTVYGKMSQTQIEWFASQLQDAITNNLHVCVFIHALPSNSPKAYSKPLYEFFDDNFRGFVSGAVNNKCCYRLSFLLDIVDAFINGESVTFTYSEHEYTFTFATAGHFVAWFAGHLHYDAAGWLTGHENQFAINVCRPTANSGEYLGTYDGDKLGVHFNYVTIDKGLRSLSVYRVGQQDTVYATQRKSFRIQYK